jgi:hypothetical protein
MIKMCHDFHFLDKEVQNYRREKNNVSCLKKRLKRVTHFFNKASGGGDMGPLPPYARYCLYLCATLFNHISRYKMSS